MTKQQLLQTLKENKNLRTLLDNGESCSCIFLNDIQFYKCEKSFDNQNKIYYVVLVTNVAEKSYWRITGNIWDIDLVQIREVIPRTVTDIRYQNKIS